MIAMTTSNSISVKAGWALFRDLSRLGRLSWLIQWQPFSIPGQAGQRGPTFRMQPLTSPKSAKMWSAPVLLPRE